MRPICCSALTEIKFVMFFAILRTLWRWWKSWWCLRLRWSPASFDGLLLSWLSVSCPLLCYGGGSKGMGRTREFRTRSWTLHWPLTGSTLSRSTRPPLLKKRKASLGDHRTNSGQGPVFRINPRDLGIKQTIDGSSYRIVAFIDEMHPQPPCLHNKKA